MADFSLRFGSYSAQGLRANNEDRCLVDREQHLFIVADGMGGQEAGEIASGLAVEIIPKVVRELLAAEGDADLAWLVKRAMARANKAIIDASRDQQETRRMGTTAVTVLERRGRVFVGNLGDSRAYLVRGNKVEQLTNDHSVAQALVDNGALTPEEAKQHPLQHVLHRFLGCTHSAEDADVRTFDAQRGDCLIIGSDGLTNFVTDDDLRDGAKTMTDPQTWCVQLVDQSLARGSTDNATCIVVVFD